MDVLIVGGGPAGATARGPSHGPVYRSGSSTGLNFPRNKPCGGGISPSRPETVPVSRGGARAGCHASVSRLYLMGRAAIATIDAGEAGGAMIRRVEFDPLLLTLRRTPARSCSARGGRAAVRRCYRRIEVVWLRDWRNASRRQFAYRRDGVHSVNGAPPRRSSGAGACSPRSRLDMMEETPADVRCDRRAVHLWVRYGFVPR